MAVTIAVRVKPGTSRTAVGGEYPGPHGPALLVAVTARAVGGRATEAARLALAAALGVRPAAVTLRHGAASRDKLFAVAAEPADRAGIEQRLAALRRGSEGGHTSGRGGSRRGHAGPSPGPSPSPSPSRRPP